MTSGAAASRPVFYPNSLVIVDLGSIFELGLSWTYHKRSPWGFSLEASGPLATASSFGRMIILATSPYLELLEFRPEPCKRSGGTESVLSRQYPEASKSETIGLVKRVTPRLASRKRTRG